MSCGHHLEDYPAPLPRKGDEIWCRKCGDYRFAHTDTEPDYKARCQECTYSRYTGQDEAYAKLFATKHGQLTGHLVEVERAIPRR